MSEVLKTIFVDAATTRDLLRSLWSTVCPACGGGKRGKQTFCRACYYRLNPALRSRLYALIGQGYESAFASAMDFLGAKRVTMPPRIGGGHE